MHLNKDTKTLVKDIEIGALDGTVIAIAAISIYHTAVLTQPCGVNPVTRNFLDYAGKHLGKGLLLGAFLGGAVGDESVNDTLPIRENDNGGKELVGDMLEEI